MRTPALLTTVLSLGVAFAPLAAYSQQTLDAQMQKMQQKNPSAAVKTAPAPMVPVVAAPASAPATTAPQSWPVNPTATGTMAAKAPIDSVGNGAIPALPLQPQTSNGVTYVNGGIGDEEMAELKAKAGEYNLHVMLSADKGEYISDVKLRVLDSKGNALVSVDDAGPYFYAHLQPGAYVLETSINGDSSIKKTKFIAPAKGAVKEHVVYK